MGGALLEIDDARGIVLAAAQRLAAEPVELADALGRTLAQDLTATASVPAFDNSAMDGFAVRAADVADATRGAPVHLEVVGESRAGFPATTTLGPRQAIAISTGAMLPVGADAVVVVEQTRRAGAGVAVHRAAAPGDWIRRTGDDIAAGRAVLASGSLLGPAELGVLASLGCEQVPCVRRPRVAVLTTGDELVSAGGELRAGAVRDSSAYSIGALARCAGAEVVTVARVPDDRGVLVAAVRDELGCDVIVVCGGVSVGDHDHVRAAMAALDFKERFWGLALKPGKPTWFGTRANALAFGLPGNPVSSMVTFILLVAPALRELSGVSPHTHSATATLMSDYEKEPGRAHAVRCRARLTDGGWEVTPTGPQGSHILTSMLGADALAIIPTDSGSVAAGAQVRIELLAAGVGVLATGPGAADALHAGTAATGPLT
jgi:molybdopterin molybdotransferase